MVRKIMPWLAVMVIWLLVSLPLAAEAQFLKSPYFEKVERGEALVVALSQGTPPFCLVDDNGIPRGIDVEIAQLLGEALGVEIQFVFPEFKDIIEGVKNGSWDLAIANMTVTIPRAKQVAFSHGYLNITQGVLLDRRYIPRIIVEGVVQSVSLHSFNDLRDLPGLVIGTWGDSTSSELLTLRHPNLEHRVYPNILTARQALRDGEINALVADSPVIEFISNYYPEDRKRFKALTRPSIDEKLAVAMHMGDPSFMEFINRFIDELIADGTMARIMRAYLDNNEWAGEVLR